MAISPIVSCLVSALVIAALLNMRHSLPMDHPNHRSLHDTPTPRTGGLAILLGAASGWAMAWPPPEQIPMLVLAMFLSAMSLIDDFRGLPITVRFGFQAASAVVLLWFTPQFPGGTTGIAVALVALLWMVNLFNFMDGSDGLAGGMAAFGFGLYSLVAYNDGMAAFAVTASSLACASAAFLWFNFYPARIFMGDAGSIPLGFLAAAMGLAGWQAGLWPVAFPILVFSPFIVDASVTLLKRRLQGKNIWQAHREHYYQRLIQMGWGHRRTALMEYGLMLACGLSALLIRHTSIKIHIIIIIGWAVVYFVLLYLIDKAWQTYSKEIAST